MDAFEAKTYSIHELLCLGQASRLQAEIEYQRQHVWSDADVTFFIDSVLRGMPIGTICLYETGSNKFEVVDGKQRIAALRRYVLEGFVPQQSHLKKFRNLDEFIGPIDDPPFIDQGFDSTRDELARRLLTYRVPALVMSGSREFAVAGFVRMNHQGYTLSPQELRNALFLNSGSRKILVSVASKLFRSSDQGGPFGELGIISPASFKRMHDVQLLTELVLLATSDNIPNRREGIDAFYRAHLNHDPESAECAPVWTACGEVLDALDQLQRAFGFESLAGNGFPRYPEHDFYAMMGAVLREGVSPTKKVVRRWRELRADASLLILDMRSKLDEKLLEAAADQGELSAEQKATIKALGLAKNNPNALNYAATFLGGQANSSGRRRTRIEVLAAVAK